MMRKPIEPGSPKSTKAQHDLIPAKPAPQADPSPHNLLPGSSPRDGTFSNETVKEWRRVSKQPIAEKGASRLPGIHLAVVMILDNSADLIVGGVVIDPANKRITIPHVVGDDDIDIELSQDVDFSATDGFKKNEVSQPNFELEKPWPHEVQVDGITPEMRRGISECAKRQSRLSQEVESVIAGVFRDEYLKCASNKKGAWRAVCQQCSLLDIKPPSYSATAERLDVLFSQEILRYY